MLIDLLNEWLIGCLIDKLIKIAKARVMFGPQSFDYGYAYRMQQCIVQQVQMW